MQFSTSAIMAATLGALAFAAPLENAANGPNAVVDNMQPRAVAPTAPPVTPAPTTTGVTPPTMPTQCNTPVGDWMVAECLSYADGEIPPTPLTKREAIPQETGMAMNIGKLVAKGFIAGDALDKRQTYYPDCGAPICFDESGKVYENKQKRDVVDAVAEDALAKRQTYYPDCGAPICFDEAGKAYKNKEKRYNPKYYPDCGAPICFDEAGTAYENKQKRDLIDDIAEAELHKRYNPKYYPDCGAPICFDAAGKAYVNKA